MLSRRGLVGCFIAAPAIVRASSLMPVKALKPVPFPGFVSWWLESNPRNESWSEEVFLLTSRPLVVYGNPRSHWSGDSIFHL